MSLNIKEVCEAIAKKCKIVHDDLIYQENAFEYIGIGADKEPTTFIDQKLEAAAIDVLNEIKVGGQLISEEIGLIDLEGPDSGYQFVLDPLDGTTNAKSRFAFYALSIGVLREGEPIYAYIYQYPSNLKYTAEKGHGAYFNDMKINVSSVSKLNNMQLLIARPFSPEEGLIYNAIQLNTKRSRVSGCPSLDVTMVAGGTFEGYVDYHIDHGLIKTHDVIAATLILKEAGGVLCDETGHEIKFSIDTTSKYNIFAFNSYDSMNKVLECMNLQSYQQKRSA